MILAIDFDDTIVKEEYPKIGPLRIGAKKYINKLFDDGHYIIIWTCRSDDAELEAEIFLLENKIRFHKVNAHNPVNIHRYGNDTRKISAHLYIDDKNISGLPTWEEIYNIVTEKQKKYDQGKV